MILTLNPDTQTLLESPSSSSPVTSLSVPRGSEVPLVVVFVREDVDGALIKFDPELTQATITAASVADPSVITTSSPHGFEDGDSVVITGSNSTPTIDGTRTITVLSPTTFSVPVNVTVAGTAGIATRTTPISLRWTVKTRGKFDQTPSLASCAAFTKTGSGSTARFTGYVNYITAGLNTALGVNPPDDTDDQEQALCMAELRWNGLIKGKSNWINHVIRNDVYKDDEESAVYSGGAAGKTAITNGADMVSVEFDVTLGSPNWHFLGTPIVANTTDPTPLGLFVVGLTSRDETGFTVQLSAETDSANYFVEWILRPDEV